MSGQPVPVLDRHLKKLFFIFSQNLLIVIVTVSVVLRSGVSLGCAYTAWSGVEVL